MHTLELKLQAQSLMQSIRVCTPEHFDYEPEEYGERFAEIQSELDDIARQIDNPTISTWRKLYELADSRGYDVSLLEPIIAQADKILAQEEKEAKAKAQEEIKRFKEMVEEAFEGEDIQVKVVEK